MIEYVIDSKLASDYIVKFIYILSYVIVKIMSSSIGNDTASAIVTTDTIELINQADSIVSACTGTNCNFSQQTQTSIIQQLSSTAQAQANNTISLLAIPISSVSARNIYNGYLNLGAAVSFTYNYQCGATTVNSTSCVENAATVQAAQDNLASILVEPTTNFTNHVAILSILAVIGIIAVFLFFIFLIIGFFESFSEVSYTGTRYGLQIQEANYRQQLEEARLRTQVVPPRLPPQGKPIVQQVAMPVSPFDTTEPVYQ